MDSDRNNENNLDNFELAPRLGAPSPRKKLRGPSSRPVKADGRRPLMHDHRCRVTRLLRTFIDEHNWEDAAAALSVLLKLWPRTGRGCTMMELRKNFIAAMEIQCRLEGNRMNLVKIRNICDVWISKLTWMNKCSKERQFVQLELALYLLTNGNIKEARNITEFLLQDRECASNPKLHLVHGLTSFQLWYSELPTEMQLKDSDMLVHLETIDDVSSDAFHPRTIDKSDCHSSSQKQKIKESTSYHSSSSIDKQEKVLSEDKHPKEGSHGVSPFGGSHVNGSTRFSEDRNELLSHEMNLDCISIFSSHGLDASLIPIHLDHSSEDIDQRIHSHRERLNAHYSDAVDHLQAALFSDPPLLGALLPFIQVLLVGDNVVYALRELKKFCKLSNSALPFRLRSRLLECFCRDQFDEISNCHETVLMKDPTCSYSVEKLIKMFRDGHYSSASLFQMIAMHLDASMGNHTIWGEFALCLLRVQNSCLSENDQDQISTNATGPKLTSSSRLSNLFLKQDEKKSWGLRFKWWSKRHFSRSRYLMEIHAGDWELVTFKAACASHLYGESSEYVQNVLGSLRENNNDDNISFLDKHMKNSLNLYQKSSWDNLMISNDV